MGVLGAGPEGDAAVVVGLDGGHRRVFLHGHVGIAFIVEQVFEYLVAVRQRCFHIAEFITQRAVHVAGLTVIVQARLGNGLRFYGFEDTGDSGQRFVFHIDEFQCLLGGEFIAGNDGGDRVTHQPYLVATQGAFVLAHRQDTVIVLEVLARQDQVHAGLTFCPGDIEVFDAGVRDMGTQQLAIEHARQVNIARVNRLTGHLVGGVDPAPRFADALESWCLAHRPDSACLRLSPAMRSTASSTAS